MYICIYVYIYIYIYIYICLYIYVYQILHTKSLNSKSSNESSFLFTEKKSFVILKFFKFFEINFC